MKLQLNSVSQKETCSSYPAALYSAFGHHISIRLYSSNFVFLYCIVYSTMYSYLCMYLLDKKQVSVSLKWTLGKLCNCCVMHATKQNKNKIVNYFLLQVEFTGVKN